MCGRKDNGESFRVVGKVRTLVNEGRIYYLLYLKKLKGRTAALNGMSSRISSMANTTRMGSRLPAPGLLVRTECFALQRHQSCFVLTLRFFGERRGTSLSRRALATNRRHTFICWLESSNDPGAVQQDRVAILSSAHRSPFAAHL